MKSKPKPSRGGFTLVEMLVVITIISVLASLTVGAAYLAFGYVKKGIIATEVGQLKMAVDQYKNEHLDYPPDGSNSALVNQHLNQVFGNRNANADAFPGGIDQAEALVFFLHGFSKNARLPLTGTKGPADRSGHFSELGSDGFDFDKTRLVDNDGDGFPEYIPASGQETPYVYFDSRTFASASYSGGGNGTAKPYHSDLQGETYAQEGKYQIISAGLDGNYGDGNGSFPNGPYSEADLDNITDFASGTLESKMP